MLKNTEEQFGLISTYIHWLSAVMVIGLFALGFWMVDLSYYSEWYREAPYYHKSFGLVLFLLTLVRVVWKLTNKTPADHGNNKVEHKLAKLAHIALYGLLLVIMFSGYLISTADGRGIELFNLITVPSIGELFLNQEDNAGDIHEISAYTLIGLVFLHAVAAVKHHFIDKDETLKRITRFK